MSEEKHVLKHSEILFDRSVWEEAWKNQSTASKYNMKSTAFDATGAFERWAREYHQQSFTDDGKKRSDRITGWIENQGVSFDGLSILDIGAASGIFTIPFATKGATVTAVEPSELLVSLMKETIPASLTSSIDIVSERFEDISIQDKGWEKKYDFAFASMCPAMSNWETIEQAISTARKYVYISTMAGSREHTLINELKEVLGVYPSYNAGDMGYIQQLLYLKDYSYTTLITKETSYMQMSVEEVVDKLQEWLSTHELPTDEGSLALAEQYIRDTYKDGMVTFSRGGKFGKILIQLEQQNMKVVRTK
ncbi:methyltransferase domain-containing protein [Paenibacillus taichungensis]|uniref:class I SAM-dependent methyltransferase n=1 Tax=Paenibacillus taichungensis TaxID=484184 RepID=UPI002DB93BC5|nr:methyltransferase domain-containing protein [Paenibacillus taichungensis]MEC0105328.1 methyltransferase domain-containing protein [Paenibacillus taichungensis]MEC0200403.1 methyltransferase domain-containing protein [Paenibacillus taichungensis]